MVHTSIIYYAIVQNPFCIRQEGLCAAIHFLFNILQCKKRKNWRTWPQHISNAKEKTRGPRTYLLESAKIHWVKNVLCIIRMLLQRDGLLEGFRLQSYEDREREWGQMKVSATLTLLLTLCHTWTCDHRATKKPLQTKGRKNQWRKKSWRGLVSGVIDYPIKSLSLRGSCMGGARWQAGMVLKESERGSCILTTG